MLMIDKGSEEGIRRRAPVCFSGWFSGTNCACLCTYSQVLLITDPTSAVDGRLESSQARGMIVGKVMSWDFHHEIYLSAFEYLSQATEIEENAKVVTSEWNGIYRRAFDRVVSFPTRKRSMIISTAELVPSVDFFKLQEVLVLKAGEN